MSESLSSRAKNKLPDRIGAATESAESAVCQLGVQAVLRRAEAHGFIMAREVQDELARIGLDRNRWQEVIRTAGPRLVKRRGRYEFVPVTSVARERQVRRHMEIHEAVEDLVGQLKNVSSPVDRREVDRVTFLQPVVLQTADLTDHRVLTRDISPTGIRLLGSRSLLGQKVRVCIPAGPNKEYVFLVRILWTVMVADDLYENGGALLELIRPGAIA